MKREVITTGAASSAPLSPGIRVGDLLYTSGQVGINRASGEIPVGVREQTQQTLENLKEVLEAGGTSLEHVIKATVFLTDMAEFEVMNEVYREYFPTDPPARSTLGVLALAREEFQVEIELTALVPGERE